MDILLPQMITLFKDQLNFVRNSDICLIPHPGVIPDGVGFPYIGLKDGNVINHELMGDVVEQELSVEIYIYDRLGRSDKSIMGLHVKARAIRELLRDREFSGTVVSVEPASEIPVSLLYTRNGLVVRKGLRFKYERED